MVKALVVVLALAAGLVPIAPAAVERWFSTGLYPTVQRSLTTLSNAVPFALLDLFAVAGVLTVVAAVMRAMWLARRTRRVGPVVRLLGNLTFAGALEAFLDENILLHCRPPPWQGFRDQELWTVDVNDVIGVNLASINELHRRLTDH